ncbi:hypothetical protein [Segatella bryantii]|uniref:hypothetical protein n=1 Tax=Segatella bryantii TaxID=77095 RepID=UPI00241D064C|nr:hypothetical protein [Segatella bryantii]
MNIYVFIGTSICDIGGGALYYKHKLQYLLDKGYKVYIFSFVKGEVIIDQLKSQQKNIISYLKFPPYFYTDSNKNKIIQHLIEEISYKDNDTIFIESNHFISSLWGEILACRLKCKHVLFIIDEISRIYSDCDLRYLKFKDQRKEVAAISHRTLPEIFKNTNYSDICRKIILSACPTETISNVAECKIDIHLHKENNTINILSLGRLNKKYILPTIKSLANYTIANNSVFFNIIFCGGPSKYESIIKKEFNGQDNIELIFLGNLYPIPLKLLRITDLGIASSGSVTLLDEFGIPCIVIDGNDCLPIGIYKYNCINRLFRGKEEPPVALDYLLNLIIKNKVVNKNFHLPENLNKEVDFSSHFQFIKNSNKEIEYYSEEYSNGFKIKFVRILSVFISLDKQNKLFKIMHKIFDNFSFSKL